MKNYNAYITGTLAFGISTAVISLLARWITANTILSSPETLIKYGLIGGIGYSLMGAVSILFFGVISTRIRNNHPNLLTLGDLFQKRLQPDGYYLMSFLILFLGLDSLFMQAVGASVLFDLLLGIPVTLSLLVFFLLIFVIAGLGGMKWIHKVEGMAIIFIFAAIIFIPMYFFINEGANHVYEGIRLLHPYLLVINNREAIFFIFTAMLIGVGQMLTDRATWQRLYMIELKKVRVSFYLTALVWSTIPLAMGGMLMIVIFDRTFDQSYLLLFELINKIKPLFLSVVFFLFCFGAILSTANAELHATTVHFVKHVRKPLNPSMTERQMYKESYFFSGILLFALLIATYFFEFSALQFLFFFGHLYASVIPVMLIIILSKRKITRPMPYAVLIGWFVGYVFSSNPSSLESIWLSFTASSLFAVASMMFADKEM